MTSFISKGCGQLVGHVDNKTLSVPNTTDGRAILKDWFLDFGIEIYLKENIKNGYGIVNRYVSGDGNGDGNGFGYGTGTGDGTGDGWLGNGAGDGLGVRNRYEFGHGSGDGYGW